MQEIFTTDLEKRKRRYKAWIGRLRVVRRQCVQVTLAMVEEFPELLRVRGHYVDSVSHQRHQHWWCVTTAGEIVDPTVSQFIDGGTGTYEPWDESHPEPTGHCHNCGGLVFDNSNHCGEQCLQETLKILEFKRGV